MSYLEFSLSKKGGDIFQLSYNTIPLLVLFFRGNFYGEKVI